MSPTIVAETEIVINVPAEEIFDYITTPTNWAGQHDGSGAFTGVKPEPAKVGVKFSEIVKHPDGSEFDAKWIVITSDRPTAFAFDFEPGFTYKELTQLKIAYSFEPAEGGTRWRRTQTLGFEEGTDLSAWDAYRDTSAHQTFQKRIKAKLEA